MQQPFIPSAFNQMMIPKCRNKGTMFVICYLLSCLRIQLRKSTYRDKNLDLHSAKQCTACYVVSGINHTAVILLHIVYHFVLTSFKESHHIHSLQISLDATKIVFTH